MKPEFTNKSPTVQFVDGGLDTVDILTAARNSNIRTFNDVNIISVSSILSTSEIWS